METRFLLVGLATDGPTNHVHLYSGTDSLIRLFGGNYTQQFTVTPTASSVTLSYEPGYGIKNEVNGKKNQLFAPAVSGNVVLFGSVGGSGNQTISITYDPYLGRNDLLFAAQQFALLAGSKPYIVRIGGSKASCAGSGWQFEAAYEGARYNGLTLTWTGSSFSMSGLAPRFKDITYVGNLNEIVSMIMKQERMNASPLRIAMSASTLPATTMVLTGGTDGSFDDAALAGLLDAHILPMDVSHVVLLNPITSGMMDNITSYLHTDYQPRLFLANSLDYTTPCSSYLTDLVTGLPSRNPMVALVLGEIEIPTYTVYRTRYAVEGAAIALAKTESYNMTNLPVAAQSFYPVLSENDLNLCKSQGVIPLMRYIGNDISAYEGVNSATTPSFLYSLKVAEVSAIANRICMAYIGQAMKTGRNSQIEMQLLLALRTVSFFSVENTVVNVYGDTMYVTIEGRLPHEILTLSFVIKN